MGAIAAQGHFTPRRKKIAHTLFPQRAFVGACHEQALLISNRTLVLIGLAQNAPDGEGESGCAGA